MSNKKDNQIESQPWKKMDKFDETKMVVSLKTKPFMNGIANRVGLYDTGKELELVVIIKENSVFPIPNKIVLMEILRDAFETAGFLDEK